MHPPGYNPLRWDCRKTGCYNTILRPKIEEFAECFPRRIAMSDVDGIVEIRGSFLFLEWKASAGKLLAGQRILFEQLTRLSPAITVLLIYGDPQTMAIEVLQVFHQGKAFPPEPCDLNGLKKRMHRWACKADQ